MMTLRESGIIFDFLEYHNFIERSTLNLSVHDKKIQPRN